MQRNITRIENDLVTTDKSEVAEKLNNFFIESAENLEIEPFSATMDDSGCSEDIEGIIYKYKSHPNIMKIKETMKLENRFVFKDMTAYELEIEISKLNSNKASMKNDIPAKMLINYIYIYIYIYNLVFKAKHLILRTVNVGIDDLLNHLASPP